MPKTSSDDILELTDIVEEGSLPEKKTDDGSESSFEDELDALFGDVEDLDFDSGDAKDPPMNPNEELSMPDMSDLNSLLDDLDREGSKAELNHRDDDSRQIEGVDELLADILPEAPAEVEDAAEEILSAKPDATASGEDELDALLDELKLTGKDEANLEADKKTAEKKLPLILDPDALNKVEKAEEKEPAAPTPASKGETGASEPAPSPEEPVPATVSEAQEELSPAPETAEEPGKDEEPALLKAAPPAQEPLEEAEDKNVDGKHLEDLDALIDDIMSPSGPEQQPEAPAREEDLPAVEKDAPALEEDAPAADPVLEEPRPASDQAAPRAEENLEELAEKLAQGPLFAAIQNMVGQELDNRFGDLENRLAEKMDKAAAAAAAKVIREEITAMLQDL